MQLLDRYLTAIKFWLPKKQRDDIAAELEANLRAAIDDRAAELGRPLTDEEIAALLKQHGAPILVASRYQTEHRTVTFGRQLIGPVVFPFYWIAIKVTLVLLLIPATIPSLFLSPHLNLAREAGHIFYRTLGLTLPALFVVTLLFAVIDAGLRKFDLLQKWQGDWDPRKLPSAARQAKQVRRSSSIAGIVMQSLFILWWWKFAAIPYVVATSAGAHLHFAPVVTSLYLPVLIIMFLNLAQHWINLMEPDWRWLPPATGMLTCALALFFLYPLLGSSPLITISEPSGLPLSPDEAAQIQSLIAHSAVSLWIGIAIFGAVFAWRLLYIVWQTLPPGRGPARQVNGVPLI